MPAFDYPDGPHIRRHGPLEYASYESYRPWLRDEFTFCCVYCRARERWASRPGNFVIDHVNPQSQYPERATDYQNLVYACDTCNAYKSDSVVADPCKVSYTECVRIERDGTIEAVNDDGRRLIAVLRLDNDMNTRYRRLWLDIIEEAERRNRDLYLRLMGYPDDLPDLSRLRPPGGNEQPKGIQQSYFAKRERGELPVTY
jgi:hypothetical protein